jgi:integrase
MAVARYSPDLFRWLALQLATCCRPVAALRMDPRVQYDADSALIDLHPAGKIRSKKRNPVVPVIDQMKPILTEWAEVGADVVRSRKTAWRTLRRVLNLPQEAEAKTIRYSVATELRRLGTVPAIQIESLLGHSAVKSVTARYAKYDPTFMAEAKAGLSSIFARVMAEADAWDAVHLLSKTGNGRVIVVDRDSSEEQDSPRWKDGAAYRTRTCDPRITNAMLYQLS